MIDRYAKIIDGFVDNIIIADQDFIDSLDDGEIYVLCTDDENAHIGGEYVDKEGFFPPKPYPSWIKNGKEWVAPKQQPSSAGDWRWNEENQEWVDVSSL